MTHYIFLSDGHGCRICEADCIGPNIGGVEFKTGRLVQWLLQDDLGTHTVGERVTLLQPEIHSAATVDELFELDPVLNEL